MKILQWSSLRGAIEKTQYSPLLIHIKSFDKFYYQFDSIPR